MVLLLICRFNYFMYNLTKVELDFMRHTDKDFCFTDTKYNTGKKKLNEIKVE